MVLQSGAYAVATDHVGSWRRLGQDSSAVVPHRYLWLEIGPGRSLWHWGWCVTARSQRRVFLLRCSDGGDGADKGSCTGQDSRLRFHPHSAGYDAEIRRQAASPWRFHRTVLDFDNETGDVAGLKCYKFSGVGEPMVLPLEQLKFDCALADVPEPDYLCELVGVEEMTDVHAGSKSAGKSQGVKYRIYLVLHVWITTMARYLCA